MDLYPTAVFSTSALAYAGSGLAPPANLAGAALTFPGGVAGAEYTDYAKAQTVRLADGAYLDDTAVAYLLNHLQKNGVADGFNITLFMNGRAQSATLGTQKVSSSIERLFIPALADDDVSPFCMFGICVDTMSAHLFDAVAWDGVEPTWSHQDGDVSLAYYQLTVTTVENKTFDIAAGHTGTLHIFSLVHPNSEPLPSKPETFDAYKEVLATAVYGVINQGGWAHLSKALGLE